MPLCILLYLYISFLSAPSSPHCLHVHRRIVVAAASSVDPGTAANRQCALHTHAGPLLSHGCLWTALAITREWLLLYSADSFYSTNTNALVACLHVVCRLPQQPCGVTRRPLAAHLIQDFEFTRVGSPLVCDRGCCQIVVRTLR